MRQARANRAIFIVIIFDLVLVDLQPGVIAAVHTDVEATTSVNVKPAKLGYINSIKIRGFVE